MDFEQIRAFLNVASLKSFSEAGEKMFISQPSVSVRIKTLEEELGVILFDRSRAREPVLTDSGRIFLDFAQAMINLQAECREKLVYRKEEAAGLVYIGASTVPGTYLLPPLLARFKEKSDSIDFNVNILDTSAVIGGVLDYSFDFGFVGLVRQDERLKYVPMIEDELILCTRKGLLPPSGSGDGIPVENLLSFHLIVREKGSATRQLLEKKLAESDADMRDFKGVTIINSLEGIKQAVKEGLGVAVLSKLSISEMVQSGSVDTHPIMGLDLKRYLYLVYHHSRVLGGAAERMKEFIIKEFTK
jgi:LysR family transcriptional regulator, transcriptional activator of the cysJI operon